ncbi:hypothetical protein [Lysobacter capsici]|uniref:hypothetical protein n=1 Tax=Lysobacter capsici TaxID=435897 RepID=UPI00287B7B83|nr:hypothetical protein [Lysobacter capsici]WND78785.1 hypothetical protein RJ610_15915 [Lysobacter capsici]WND83980.1 hypothetical protein RJ609_15925 [Lysobacter capsici]
MLVSKPDKLGLPYAVHGLRSSFRDWAAEETEAENFIVEMALARFVRTPSFPAL